MRRRKIRIILAPCLLWSIVVSNEGRRAISVDRIIQVARVTCVNRCNTWYRASIGVDRPIVARASDTLAGLHSDRRVNHCIPFYLVIYEGGYIRLREIVGKWLSREYIVTRLVKRIYRELDISRFYLDRVPLQFSITEKRWWWII